MKSAEHSNIIELTYMSGINTCVRENESVLRIFEGGKRLISHLCLNIREVSVNSVFDPLNILKPTEDININTRARTRVVFISKSKVTDGHDRSAGIQIPVNYTYVPRILVGKLRHRTQPSNTPGSIGSKSDVSNIVSITKRYRQLTG